MWKYRNQSSHFKPTEVVSAHLCIEFEPCEGIAVAGASSLDEPVAHWLIHEGLGIAATHEDYAVRVAFGNGPVLAKPARL